MDYQFALEILIKLALSVLLGGLIGIERELSKHPAGLRTHILVSLGATIFMLIGYHAVDFAGNTATSLDATRMGAGIVTGIGFLGAGAIMKEGVNVQGLTTAASIWVTAAIGLCVASELYVAAFIGTILVLFVLVVFSRVELRIGLKEEHGIVEVITAQKKRGARKISELITDLDIVVESIEMDRLENNIKLRFHLEVPANFDPAVLIDTLTKEKYISHVEWIELQH